MSDRLPNQSHLTRAQVWNLGVIATQLGIENEQEMSQALVLGVRLGWHRDDVIDLIDRLIMMRGVLV